MTEGQSAPLKRRHECIYLIRQRAARGEHRQAPAAYRALGERVFQLLKTTPGKPGRMEVVQGLFHDRRLPAMLMEQMVDYNSRLGHCPEIADRSSSEPRWWKRWWPR